MIEVLYEDSDLLVVNKPCGLPTQPTVDKSRPNLYGVLTESNAYPYLGLHHRLDAPTSGVVLLTKSKRANEPVSELFKGRNIKKIYRCWVKGAPKDKDFSVENHLKQQKIKGKMLMKVVTSGGDYAHTKFKLLRSANFKKIVVSELEAELLTGRMHQIRIHCRTLNLPILGDALYGPIDRHFKRLYLHAQTLEFEHPFSHQFVKVTAPLPSEFESLAERLEIL